PHAYGLALRLPQEEWRSGRGRYTFGPGCRVGHGYQVLQSRAVHDRRSVPRKILSEICLCSLCFFERISTIIIRTESPISTRITNMLTLDNSTTLPPYTLAIPN